jgi:alkanesulfonate monooxygenase SsuD/methylene tetrahydromethanopterin reductase-like flavin-dependent oxidoreductase (luciferase family)
LRSGSVSLRLYPHLDLEPTNTVAELRAQARLAEDAGFDGLMVSEHHNGFAGYLPNPIQAAGWLLEATESTWGRDAGPLPDDPAIQWCVANPIPVLSAANSPAACRRAAAADVGLLFDSLTAVDRCKALATTYREAGGHGPIALIRRASRRSRRGGALPRSPKLWSC